jgi:gluconate 2-dehydrogenase gamma chain
MNDWHYPTGTVRALLETDLVTDPTRRALKLRLEPATFTPGFFSSDELETLRAIGERLIVLGSSGIDPAAEIDARLVAGTGDGWRYDAMPSDGEAYRLGLRGLEETARKRFGARFVALETVVQDRLLAAVQRGEVRGGAWARVAPARFFEDLLSEFTEMYYSHPLAQEEIGYAGLADAPGWARIGLDELEDREPRPLETVGGNDA